MKRNDVQSQGKFKTPCLTHSVLFIFLLSCMLIGCFDLIESADAPCGGPDDCSSPRQCIEGQCISACYNDEECALNERCDRQLCVIDNLLEGESTAGESTAGESTAGESTAGESP